MAITPKSCRILGFSVVALNRRTKPNVEDGGRSTSYPFGYLQVLLNEKGEGTGKIMAATKITFNKKKDQVELESFGNQYIKAANVRPNK